MSYLKQIKLCCAGLVLGVASCAAMADVVPVVSSKSAVSGLNNAQVVDIFLGKVTRYPNGDEAVPVDQAEGSVIRDAFYQQFARRSAAQIKAHWSKLVFTGKGQPPREVSPSERVKRVLAENPKLIGYIDSSELDANVKVVLLVQ